MKYSKEFNGIIKFFSNRNYSENVHVDKKVLEEMVKDYCLIDHNFNSGTNECAKIVQDNFQEFVKLNWMKKTGKKYNLIVKR